MILRLKCSIVYAVIVVGLHATHSNVDYVTQKFFREIQQATKTPYLKLDKIITHIQKTEQLCAPLWETSYGVITKWIREHRLMTGCEIGVGFGAQAFDILRHTDVTSFQSVDPFEPMPNNPYLGEFTTHHWDVLHHIIKRRLSRFKKQFKLVRRRPRLVVASMKSHALDFVVINSHYACDDLTVTLNSWFNKVKPDGYIFVVKEKKPLPHKQPAVPHVDRVIETFATRNVMEITHRGQVAILRRR